MTDVTATLCFTAPLLFLLFGLWASRAGWFQRPYIIKNQPPDEPRTFDKPHESQWNDYWFKKYQQEHPDD